MPAVLPIVTIEFYSSGVRISDGKRILANSVSCALIESGGSVLVGEQAEHQAHIRPRECSRNFWDHLSDNSNTKYVISNAEIALHHLKYLWNIANTTNHEAILITPTTLDKHALGLLLGICKKLSINVVGIVANATLVMQHPVTDPDCKLVYLDLLLQQLVITELIQSDVGISLKQQNQMLNFGLEDFIQNYALGIAKEFISETRFDPLHSANDEQQFFNALPFWLNMLDDNESIECTLTSSEKIFSVTVENQHLKKENKLLFEEVANYLNILFHSHNNIAIYCSSSCKQVFGLHDFLRKLPGCAVIQLDEISLADQAIQYGNEIIANGQVHYINTLPWKNNGTPIQLQYSPGILSNLSNTPTHILICGHAHSLQQAVFIANSSVNSEAVITLEKTDDSLCKIYANNMSVEIQIFGNQSINLNHIEVRTVVTAKIGDSLNIEGHLTDYLFIKVVGDEA